MAVFEAEFKPGDIVRHDDLRMRVLAVQFAWGMAFPRYHCEWVANGAPVDGWFHAPDLGRAECPD